MTTNADLYGAYVRGWRCGAVFRRPDPTLAEHADERIQAAYVDGWADGRSTSKAAFKAAESTYGYAPSILRLCDQEPTDDHES